MSSDDQLLFLQSMLEEIQICKYLRELTIQYSVVSSILIKEINIVDLINNRIEGPVDVLIEDGIIVKIEKNMLNTGDLIIESQGKYLFPGLIDMHVHHELSNSQHLLHIANGILSVREMCGYPGVLKLKDAILNNEILAPNLYVASNMLNEFQYDRFTTKVQSSVEIREAIQSFKGLGYDFVKIWNKFSIDNFKTAIEEANQRKIPVVAHIPVGIDVKTAIDAGLRTFEHFKGYLDDSTMKIPDQDYVSATPITGQWNCPTFCVFDNERLVGTEAKDRIEKMDEIAYLSNYQLNKWKIEIEERSQNVSERGINIPEMHLNHQKKIFKDLLEKGVEFISGTDFGGGYPFCIPGFGLLDELEFMYELGLSLIETLRSTTYHAGKALDKKIGLVEEGYIANLLILDENPLNTLSSLRGSKELIAGSRILRKEDSMKILNVLREIHHTEYTNFDEKSVIKEIVEFFSSKENQIFVRPEYITKLCEILVSMNEIETAKQIYQLVVNYTQNQFNIDYLDNLNNNF